MTDPIDPPVAYLFTNGLAAFFDAGGGQIEAYQRQGWEGVHEFLAAYPDARVLVAGEDDILELDERAIEQIAGDV